MNIELGIGLIIFLSSLNTISVAGEDLEQDWQLKRLNSPTEQQLRSERDKVFIYDGLYARQIDAALDDHFDRIDHMMFVRVKVVDKGEEIVLDDDCD